MTQNLTHPSLRCKAHWQNAQNQRYNQILPKSLPARPTPTHGGKDSAANLTEKLIENKKRPVGNTRYKTLGFKWLFERSAPHQSMLSGDSDVLRNPQRFHTAIRYNINTNGIFTKRN